MTNHYHLVLETPNLDLSAGMQRLNGDYAQWFNRRHDFEGHLFRHRFHAGFIERESHALEVLRYVALNPVRAGLCATPSEWSWSSYARAMSHPASLATAALSFFGEDPHHARERLRAFVEAPDPH